MSDDAQSRRERADRLRKQIDKAKSPDKNKDDNPADIKPGESPKEYIDRRSHPPEKPKD